MFRKDQFEKFSTAHSSAPSQNRSISGSWKADRNFGNAFAFLILSLLLHLGAASVSAEEAPPSVDLNQATSAELEALPGIGAVKAAAILAVRDAKGGFDSMEELESVRGIGPALMTKLRPLVHLGKSRGPSVKKRGQTSAKPKAVSGSAAKTSAGALVRSKK